MFNERGSKMEEAGPSCPALILGLNGAPQAGAKCPGLYFCFLEMDRFSLKHTFG